MVCGIGYSNILFGLMVIESQMGQEIYHQIFGIFKIKKIYTPWIMIAFIQATIPNADIIGHMTGMIAAYMLRNFAISYFFLPSYRCIFYIENKL